MNEINYTTLLKQIKSLTEGEENLVANLSNTVAILMSELEHFWIGFYIVDTDSNQLILGPFQGPVACTRIPFGRGVCGTSWSEKKTMVIENVHNFTGHIACSSETNSEIVLPVFDKKGKVLAVLDIDSKLFSTFTQKDKLGLEPICHHISTLF